tara:strand:+ start:3409 stop:4299 length:891 start_codon:yes stop_codon:yes gene_type:complete
MKSQLDLNLLKVLSLLNKHRQLKPVAKAIGKTESAVSKHLSKLREQLGDPLFVRGAFEYEPTEFTIQLLPQVEKGLDLIADAVQKDEFDPKTYDKPITIALPSLGQYLVGKDLMVDLMQTFPQAFIHITTWSDASIQDVLDDKIDVGVQYFNPDMTKTIYQKHIGRYLGGIICSRQYCSKTLEEKLAMPYILMEMKGWQHSKAVTKHALEEHGIHINKVATVDNITCLFQLLEATESATLLPVTRHLEECEDYCVSELPQHLQLEHPPSVVANYKLVNQNSPLHQILVNKIKQHLF